MPTIPRIPAALFFIPFYLLVKKSFFKNWRTDETFDPLFIFICFIINFIEIVLFTEDQKFKILVKFRHSSKKLDEWAINYSL